MIRKILQEAIVLLRSIVLDGIEGVFDVGLAVQVIFSYRNPALSRL